MKTWLSWTDRDWYAKGRDEAVSALADGSVDDADYGGRSALPADVVAHWQPELDELPRRRARKARRALLAGVYAGLEN